MDHYNYTHILVWDEKAPVKPNTQHRAIRLRKLKTTWAGGMHHAPKGVGGPLQVYLDENLAIEQYG